MRVNVRLDASLTAGVGWVMSSRSYILWLGHVISRKFNDPVNYIYDFKHSILSLFGAWPVEMDPFLIGLQPEPQGFEANICAVNLCYHDTHYYSMLLFENPTLTIERGTNFGAGLSLDCPKRVVSSMRCHWNYQCYWTHNRFSAKEITH